MQIFYQALTTGIMISLILILVTTGLCLIFGILDIVNFAHGEFYMLGGFGVWWFFDAHPIMEGMPEILGYIVATIITMVVVGLIGILVEKVVYKPLRLVHTSMMIASLGIISILQATALVSFGPDDKSITSPFTGRLTLGSFGLSEERVVAIICCVAFVIAFYFLIDRTKIGKAMRAVAQDSEAAMAQGINVEAIYSIAMGIGCALAAAGGALIGPIFYVNPYMGVEPLLLMFAVIIIGGLGSLPGAIIGGFVIGLTQSFVTTYVDSHVAMIVIFLIMIGVLLIRPTGIFGHAN